MISIADISNIRTNKTPAIQCACTDEEKIMMTYKYRYHIIHYNSLQQFILGMYKEWNVKNI